jgi:hypothetical protein
LENSAAAMVGKYHNASLAFQSFLPLGVVAGLFFRLNAETNLPLRRRWRTGNFHDAPEPIQEAIV